MSNKLNKLLKERQRAYERLEAIAQKNVNVAYKNALNSVRKNVAAIYEKFEVPTENDLRKYNRLASFEKQVKDEIKELDKVISNITAANIKKAVKEGYLSAGYSFESGIGVRLNFKLMPVKSMEFALKDNLWLDSLKLNNGKLMSDIKREFETTLRQNARQEIVQGLEQGKPYTKIAKAIKERFNVSASRSRLITRTEMHKSHSFGRVEGITTATDSAKRLGLVTQKVWRHNGAKEPRPDHVQMDGEPADENGVFTLPDRTTTEAPGLTGLAKHDINCSCSAEFEVLNLDNVEIDERLQDITFEEWQKTI
jgi:hypothetical protein